MNAYLRFLKKVTCIAGLFPMRVFPVKRNRVMLHNDLAYNYSANPKYVGDYLYDKYPGEFEIIISVKDPDKYSYLNDSHRKVVKFNSLKYFYYALTSKVFLSNSGGYSYLPIRKSQYVINTHHGGGAYKKCGIHMYEDTKIFRRDLKLSSERTSVFLSSSKRFTEVMAESMVMPLDKFWEIGMPRNDFLVNHDTSNIKDIRQRIGLKEDQKLVLFAPTYRKPEDNYFNESVAVDYGIDSKRVCEALQKRFGGNWVFGLRLHPCVTNTFNLDDDNVINLSGYGEMQELLLAADVMINDFSSSMWDFMLTGKPCFTFAKDLQHYIETTEVYTPVSEWPFPQSTDNEKLISDILNFDEVEYKAECDRHYNSLQGCETGKATRLVCERIVDICK